MFLRSGFLAPWAPLANWTAITRGYRNEIYVNSKSSEWTMCGRFRSRPCSPSQPNTAGFDPVRASVKPTSSAQHLGLLRDARINFAHVRSATRLDGRRRLRLSSDRVTHISAKLFDSQDAHCFDRIGLQPLTKAPAPLFKFRHSGMARRLHCSWFPAARVGLRTSYRSRKQPFVAFAASRGGRKSAPSVDGIGCTRFGRRQPLLKITPATGGSQLWNDYHFSQ